MDLVLRARRAIVDGAERSCTVWVEAGRIAAVGPFDADMPAERTVDLGDDVVLLPGLVDTHVHVNDPGRADWEGFPTATAAAAAGGVTTLVDMPLNSIPPTVDLPALEAKRDAARGRVHVDVGFWGGAVPGKLGELPALHEAGVFGFKCFLLHSGVDEFPPLSDGELAEALRTVARLDSQLIVHAEDAAVIDAATAPSGRDYQAFLRSRPPQAERTAIGRVIELAGRAAARAHILHLSDAGALPLLERAGAAITVETCPHYLSFTAEEVPDGATQFKCCPPIREAANREALWRGLGAGVIDTVVTDHSPCTPELKRFDTGDFRTAWGGVAGLQVGLPAVWTGARARGFTLADVVRWMASRPAELAGMRHKGRIIPGFDADFCVFAPDEAFVVDVARLAHRNPVSAYHGRPLAGVVRSTWLRGEEITGDRPAGKLLRRGEC
ncbi:allantoinase AllB [Amycolatopsis suaedae]|uniref:allantoinase n=1 Tax=Amycolatopsis suaedae TaxID=2510978 RepID=A0A4Q7JDQ0_9PSEU|nr:allantoinase AllB [Amycolatopsis suaedae]RZQ64783.1 allantoinase AllB [Amycolatopsis suaedae]